MKFLESVKGFLHCHPKMELMANIPSDHVVVDKEDWKQARQCATPQPQWISVKDRLPGPGEEVWAALQHFQTRNYRYAELKKVAEGDCDFRTVDDNSEIAHEWNVTHWRERPEPPKQEEAK